MAYYATMRIITSKDGKEKTFNTGDEVKGLGKKETEELLKDGALKEVKEVKKDKDA